MWKQVGAEILEFFQKSDAPLDLDTSGCSGL